MELSIHHLIIHELQKEPDNTDAHLFLTDHLMPLDDRSESLVEKLYLTFDQKTDTIQGYLSSPEDALFPGYFQLLIEQDFAETAFIDFSRETMQALQLSLQGVTGAKGGYLVFTDYTYLERHFLGIFLIRDNDGLVFSKDTTNRSFDLQFVRYLNTDRLAMACRINIDQYKAGNQRCLELIKHAKSQRTISEYFQNWIGLDRPESGRELTQTFLEVVNELPLPVDQESGSMMQEDEFRKEVLNFAMRSPHKTIDIHEFDEKFYGSEPTTQKYIEEQSIPLEETFRFDQSALRKYYNYRVAANGISLQFNHGHYHRKQIEIEGDSIVIRSEALVQSLLEQLEQ